MCFFGLLLFWLYKEHFSRVKIQMTGGVQIEEGQRNIEEQQKKGRKKDKK